MRGKVAGQDALAISHRAGNAWDEELLGNSKAGPGQHIPKR